MVNGLYTALITPFTDQGALDEEGLVANIRFQVESGVDGILVLGTTGESPTLSPEEKQKIITIARRETEGKLPLMVGTGTNCTKTTIEQTRLAQEAGADSTLVIVPYYNKPTQEGIYRHFQTLCDAVDIPVILYHHPGRTGVTASIDMIQKLPIAGIKEASDEFSRISEVVEKLTIPVLSGNDALAWPLISIGGHGLISVASNLIPQKIKQLLTDAELHHQLAPLFRVLNSETNPIPIKTAMNHCGMAAGPCRLPLCEMAEQTSQHLKEIVALCLRETQALPS